MTASVHRATSGRALDELDSTFRALVDDDVVPGLAYGVVDRTGPVHAAGHGVAHLDGAAPDSATAFRIASMTKSFTAASLMTLADTDGRMTDQSPSVPRRKVAR